MIVAASRMKCMLEDDVPKYFLIGMPRTPAGISAGSSFELDEHDGMELPNYLISPGSSLRGLGMRSTEIGELKSS